MSIFGTIYNGTTGLVTFSKGLDVISNNVANLNTPGFKRDDLLFRDLFYQYRNTGEADARFSTYKNGGGVTESGTTTSFTQGDIQQTGNQIDVAVNGNGFLILRDGGQTFYSRVGQFEVDDEGYVISTINDARVAGIDAGGELIDINLSPLRTNPARATTEVSFFNNLSSGSTEHVIEDVRVFDSLGDAHLLKVTFTNNSSTTPRSWLVEVEDENDVTIATGKEIRFQGNGSPLEDFNSFSIAFEPEAAEPVDITFFFGEPGSFRGATSLSAGASSNLAVESQNGFSFGAQTALAFDEDGVLQVAYSNGEVAPGPRLALAWINELQDMQQIGRGLFTFDTPGRLQIDAANEGVMGNIIAASIEISNVELSQEFTDLVIVQRGFQVSSQVVSIANEMLQQLLDSAGGRR
ncbi:flagellar hook-basal body complex protein [Exilibacterium tricleocarpae]|uniref:Flagellar hook protein FlgE n=1 Tax=Exilibacterium tricleocarpae TaxID=2591008 RepID=A0A545T861_9GAMM|nr:flagellar hook-basal body complex protein [Exilibacterium tricleocarpae]TQV73417.1 flagellar hook-basal body complex protein [Exilibacterium tricleocarpae]